MFFLTLFFSPRRLGVELGKSVVYQESNSGEAKHLMSNINELWFPVATVTHEYIKTVLFIQRLEWMWKNLSVDKTSLSFRPFPGETDVFSKKKRKMIHLLKVVFGVLKCLSSSDTNIELEKTKEQTKTEKSLD